ncbi:MAG: PAS-domain containing protein [Proteobacteria bacterium]|nr:PAS-domain containing protein [Pseudomonadota bacterium]
MADDRKHAGDNLVVQVKKMDQAICIFSNNGTLLYFNTTLLEFFELPEHVAYIGAQRAEIVRFLAERGDFGDGDVQQLTAERMLFLRREANVRYQYRALNGRILDIRRETTSEGQSIATFTDITGARRREAAVATIAEAVSHTAGQRYLQSLVNAMSRALAMEWVIIGALDHPGAETVTTLAASRGGVTVGNINYCLRGSPCANVIGQTICIIPDRANKLFPDDQVLVEHGIKSYIGAPLHDIDGKALGVLSAFDAKPLQDDSIAAPILKIFAPRVAAEMDWLWTLEDLRTSERRFRNVAEVGSDWLWEMDADLHFSWIADNVEALTGLPADQYIGRSRDDFRAEDDDEDDWVLHMATLRAHEPFRDFQYRRELLDGRTMWVSNSGVPFFGQDGGFLGYFGASSNITERKRAEVELRQAKQRSEDANRAKSRFLAGVSHELRTPLNAIIGFSEIIGTEMFGAIDNPNYVQYGKDIQISGQLLLGLINDILDLSQIEADELPLKEAPNVLRGLVDESVRLFLRRALEANINISVETSGAPRSVYVDGRRIKQILVNLIGNAIKFTASGGWVEVRAGLNWDGWLMLEVVDSGIGMAAKDIDRALEPFSQLGSELKHGQEGVGLGLSIASRMAELHGGRLLLTSEPNVGTRAKILLPASRIIGQDGARTAIDG